MNIAESELTGFGSECADFARFYLKGVAGSLVTAKALGIDLRIAAAYALARPLITAMFRIGTTIGGGVVAASVAIPYSITQSLLGNSRSDPGFHIFAGGLMGFGIGYGPAVYAGSKVTQQLLGCSLGMRSTLALEISALASRVLFGTSAEKKALTEKKTPLCHVFMGFLGLNTMGFLEFSTL